MITNAREYSITRAQAAKLVQALDAARGKPAPAGVHADVYSAELAGIESELRQLRADLVAYEALRDGRTLRLSAVQLADLPAALIQARIANGMSQKEFAERLGIHEQQVQRYESTQYRAASFERLLEIAEVLGIRVEQNITFAAASFKRAVSYLRKLGFADDFLRRRLLPTGMDEANQDTAGSAFEALKRIGHVFGWQPEDLAGSELPYLSPALAGGALFKLPRGRNREFLAAYTAYAYRLACGAARSAAHLPRKPIPLIAAEARRQILAGGPMELRRVIDWAWDLGIIVIPVGDSAAFHAAFWRIEGRNVVILKQKTHSAERWMHDLLHEVYHASLEPDLLSRTVLHEDDAQDGHEGEEALSNDFALDVVLDGKANELVIECARAAGGDGRKLKAIVPKVAERHGVPVGALANQVAWTLDRQDPPFPYPWWGVAQGLQTDNAADLTYACRLCFERLVPPASDDPDVELLFRALRDEEGP